MKICGLILNASALVRRSDNSFTISPSKIGVYIEEYSKI